MTKHEAIAVWLDAARKARRLVGISSKSKAFRRLTAAERHAEDECRKLGVIQSDINAYYGAAR